MVKRIYVQSMRRLRRRLARDGKLSDLDAWARHSPGGKWVRSLLSIYDVEDLAGLDVPWWTMRAAARVSAHLKAVERPRVFEWGAGASTVWLARRAWSVTTIEHDGHWAETVAGLAPSNVTIRVIAPRPSEGPSPARSEKRGFTHLDFAEYVQAIDATDDMYDLIAIDGRSREACLSRAVAHLRPGGLIVLDNVERARYRRALGRLGVPADVTWTVGATPCLPYPTGTALIGLRSG